MFLINMHEYDSWKSNIKTFGSNLDITCFNCEKHLVHEVSQGMTASKTGSEGFKMK